MRTINRLALLLPCALALACTPDDGESGGDTEADATTGATEDAGASSTSGEGTSAGGSEGGTTGAATETGTVDTGGTGEPPPPGACPDALDPALELTPGSHDMTLEYNGELRSFTVEVPSGYLPGTPAPLMLNLHGFGSNAWQQALFSQMNYDADARDYIVVYPGGLEMSWNGGACCGDAADTDRDDVGFLGAIVDALAPQLCYDPARVYSTGMSNGGFMSHRLGCDAAERFAAIAPVAGAIGIEDCAPSRPVPVYIVHGAVDQAVPAELALTAFAFWAEHNGCEGEPTRSELGGGTYCDLFEAERCEGGAAVQLCMLAQLGHCWPGGSAELCELLGDTYEDTVDANITMMDFFDQHRLP